MLFDSFERFGLTYANETALLFSFPPDVATPRVKILNRLSRLVPLLCRVRMQQITWYGLGTNKRSTKFVHAYVGHSFDSVWATTKTCQDLLLLYTSLARRIFNLRTCAASIHISVGVPFFSLQKRRFGTLYRSILMVS